MHRMVLDEVLSGATREIIGASNPCVSQVQRCFWTIYGRESKHQRSRATMFEIILGGVLVVLYLGGGVQEVLGWRCSRHRREAGLHRALGCLRHLGHPTGRKRQNVRRWHSLWHGIPRLLGAELPTS